MLVLRDGISFASRRLVAFIRYQISARFGIR
jgi:hypothetical protein